jgi:hypothetical protein
MMARKADTDPYVRKTTVLAVAKLYGVVLESVENSGLLPALLQCLRDENPMSCRTQQWHSSKRTRGATPYFVLSEQTATLLIVAIVSCGEWSVLAKDTPGTAEEAAFLIKWLIQY